MTLPLAVVGQPRMGQPLVVQGHGPKGSGTGQVHKSAKKVGVYLVFPGAPENAHHPITHSV